MFYYRESHLQRIAAHIITFKNLSARKEFIKNKIALEELSCLHQNELLSLKLTQEEINNLKKNYKKVAEKEILKCSQNGVELIFRDDKSYPFLLSEIFDPPDYLYVIGDSSVLLSEKIAVVGSRRGSSYGISALNFILPDLCHAGLTIVSGMAYGIDSMSHKIAIREKGKTIGVNAGGLLNFYPAGNKALIKAIVENGCVISEFPMDIVPRPFLFPVRNRIIAGISRAVCVVEAALKSGSLITARLALEQNRDIFAIPGRIDSVLSKGTNYLLMQGAKLIRNSQDILDEYGMTYQKNEFEKNIVLTSKEKKLLDLMGVNEVNSIDYFVENLSFTVSEIISLLMGLVLKNIVIEEEGGYRKR